MPPIYLDYNATTPIDPAVREAMVPFLEFTGCGNPSSAHALGRQAHRAVAAARAQVAAAVGADPDEIVFTGGGSEASNLAIKGVIFPLLFGLRGHHGCLRETLHGGWAGRLRSLFRRRLVGLHLITSVIEHPATLAPMRFLQDLGCRVTLLPVDHSGVVDLEALRRALRQPTALVSIMHSNNEVGTLQPIAEAAQLAHDHRALIHVDAAQSIGKVRVHVRELNVDLLTVAGHKFYAPKGVGALFVRRGIMLEPLLHGADHESGRRAGTENVLGVVGLGRAAELAAQSLPAATERLAQLRDRLWSELSARLGAKVVRHAVTAPCLPNTLNVSFLGQVGSELLARTPAIAASTGSACHEGQVTVSPVLTAMGVPPAVAQGAVRLSVGRFTMDHEIDAAVTALVESVLATSY